MSLEAEIENKKEEARMKAITNMARYKFMNFGYWAAVWIHLNRLSGKKDPSPFRPYVNLAVDRLRLEELYFKGRPHGQSPTMGACECDDCQAYDEAERIIESE